jgi:multidrug efflux pump subunit AcrA (membrane-fusion protein)
MTQINKPKASFFKHPAWRIALFVAIIASVITIFQCREKLVARVSKAFASSDEDPVPVTKLSKQPFLLKVPSTGEIVGMATTPVLTPSTPSGSMKLSWLIAEGSYVKAGDPIVRFDSTDANLNLEKQQKTLDENQERAAIKTNQQSTDEKTLHMDHTDAELAYNYAMTVMPQDETIFSKWDIITAKADAVYAKARIDFLKNKQKTQTRIARSDQQILDIERNRAQSEIDVIKITLNSMELRAPASGMVIFHRDRMKDPQIGDECWPGQVLVELVDLNVLQAKMYVLERDGGDLSKGKPVLIKLDAVTDKDFSGTITSVSSVAGAIEMNSVLRYFTCDVAIAGAERELKRIRPGMHLRGDVVLEKYDSCFVVPPSAVTYREKEGDSLVYVRAKNAFAAKTVKTGLSSHGEAIILDGVQEGDLIALRNPFETRKLSLPDFSKGTQSGRGFPGMPPMPPPGAMMGFPF